MGQSREQSKESTTIKARRISAFMMSYFQWLNRAPSPEGLNMNSLRCDRGSVVEERSTLSGRTRGLTNANGFNRIRGCG